MLLKVLKTKIKNRYQGRKKEKEINKRRKCNKKGKCKGKIEKKGKR